MRATTLFLDARRTSVYRDGHIAGARPFSVWEADVDDKVKALFAEGRDQSAPVVIYCSGGDCEDSHMLGQKLYMAGFDNVLVYKDGYPGLGETRPARRQGRHAVREKLLSPWLTVRVQFVLAALFVVAGLAKIADPPGFAHEIHNYRILPGRAVNVVALVLPWLEVVTGVALFFGIFRADGGADLRRASPRLHRRARREPRPRSAGRLRLLRDGEGAEDGRRAPARHEARDPAGRRDAPARRRRSWPRRAERVTSRNAPHRKALPPGEGVVEAAELSTRSTFRAAASTFSPRAGSRARGSSRTRPA